MRGTQEATHAGHARAAFERWLSDRFGPGRSESLASGTRALHLARPRGRPAPQ